MLFRSLRVDVFAKGRFRPNILLGFGYSWLNIENNKTDGVSLSDETFQEGMALNLGTGLAFYFNPRWFISGTLMNRWQSYGSIDGIPLDEDVSGSGASYAVGIAYTF